MVPVPFLIMHFFEVVSISIMKKDFAPGYIVRTYQCIWRYFYNGGKPLVGPLRKEMEHFDGLTEIIAGCFLHYSGFDIWCRDTNVPPNLKLKAFLGFFEIMRETNPDLVIDLYIVLHNLERARKALSTERFFLHSNHGRDLPSRL
jgi:hypothetical protein